MSILFDIPMTNEVIEKMLQAHESRIRALEEKLVTKTSSRPEGFEGRVADYSGPTGGVRYLVSKRFFREKRELAAVRGQLSDEGYNYSRQAVHEALKVLSRASGLLVALKEGSRKTYVERK